MAFLGFLTVLAIGGGFFVGGVFAIIAAKMVSSVHRGDHVIGWVLLAVGAALLFVAFSNSPVSVELHSAAIKQGEKQ